MSQRVSLHAGLFYNGILRFDHDDRELLLDFQKEALEADRLLSPLFLPIHRFTEGRLRRDVDRQLGHRTLNCPPPEPFRSYSPWGSGRQRSSGGLPPAKHSIPR
jgi:hypothetical protein